MTILQRKLATYNTDSQAIVMETFQDNAMSQQTKPNTHQILFNQSRSSTVKIKFSEASSSTSTNEIYI